jgi:hypothetical protein
MRLQPYFYEFILLFFNHQSLTDFLGPQGPSSAETQGLLMSITLPPVQEDKATTKQRKIIFLWIVID